MSSLTLIQPQPVDFETQQTCDWLDPLPVIGQAGLGGIAAASTNIGTGTLTVASIVGGTPLGAYRVTVITAGALAQFSVADPNGALIAQGATGVPLYAGGITLTVTQGATPFAVGDSFAVGVLPAPVDLSGLRFDLDCRAGLGSATFALQASTADATPTIINGGTSGVIAMRVLKAALARCPTGTYPYSILATDPATGLTVPAFYGTIHHVAVAAQLGS
ncbi:hypothetical protein SAMN02799622_00830 [Methylobacterium sp. UNC378MF]|uniref:hypothetical protein n=1 Tax=Methylobacterium sp. UNC378MF TaxID=1502748 RepID=UPI00088D70FA|nr:hypothetical protein [Methylobacterium sp. UNC378MF]SDA12851.1 hypothetical protein SAMN02799622_00830 [Methylobacterium sp. UNC378MF]